MNKKKRKELAKYLKKINKILLGRDNEVFDGVNFEYKVSHNPNMLNMTLRYSTYVKENK